MWFKELRSDFLGLVNKEQLVETYLSDHSPQKSALIHPNVTSHGVFSLRNRSGSNFTRHPNRCRGLEASSSAPDSGRIWRPEMVT